MVASVQMDYKLVADLILISHAGIGQSLVQQDFPVGLQVVSSRYITLLWTAQVLGEFKADIYSHPYGGLILGRIKYLLDRRLVLFMSVDGLIR